MRLVLLLCLALPAAAHAAEPTEETLLAAWEELQRADPKVTVLEKTGEGSYRFETEHFPYSGTLVVTDAVVDDRGDTFTDAVGYVQVKLPDAGDSLATDHAFAYSIWQRGNTLYWDAEAQRWIGWDEQQERWRDYDPAEGSFWGDWFWLAVLLVFLVVVTLISRKANRNVDRSLEGQNQALAQQQRAIEMTERSLELHEETNRLLREVRDQLARKDS